MKRKVTRIKKLFITMLLVFTSLNISAQTWTNYDASDGLIDAFIYSITQNTNDNNLWFGSWVRSNGAFGLSRFDGVTFTNYSTNDGLSHDDVWDLLADNDGNIWVGTYDGLSKYDGSIWTTLTTDDGLIGNEIRSLFQDENGNIWVGCLNLDTGEYGVNVFDGISWTSYLDISVNNITQSDNGNMWFGGGNGVYEFDGSTWTHYDESSGLSSNDVYTISFDVDNNLWAGNYSGLGLDKFDGTSWTTYTTEDGLTDNFVRAIIQDSNGNQWFGTNEGISKFDGTTWTTYNVSDGLINNHVRSLEEDTEGNIWIGTWEGVSKFNPILGVFDTLKQEFSIYPNPTTSILNINTEATIATVDVYSVLGKKVLTLMEGELNNIDISKLVSGVYFIKITSHDNLIGVKRFIVN